MPTPGLKILIVNTVPLNGGDEALLRATIYGLCRVFPTPEIQVLTSNPRESSAYLPGISFDYDLEYVRIPRFGDMFKPWELKKFLKSLIRIGAADRIRALARVRGYYKDSDIVLSGAGGYIHDFYDNRGRFRTFEYLVKLGKPFFLLGQSIGPFWKVSSKTEVKKIFEQSSGIYLRESKSLEFLNGLIGKDNYIHLGTDLAFLLHDHYPHLFRIRKYSGDVLKIAMNFRIWKDQMTTQGIVRKAVGLVNFLVMECLVQITFISTCQGIEGYIDDSELAKHIMRKLDPKARQRCKVIDTHFGAEDLIKQYSEFDAYIGMRLHGSILSMLGGTPAFNISYEAKTEGIFKDGGLDTFYCEYAENVEVWKERASSFIDTVIEGNHSLEEVVPNLCNRAKATFQDLRNRCVELQVI